MQTSKEAQQTINFSEAEAACGERWRDVGLAFDRLGSDCDSAMVLFLNLVFSFTDGGNREAQPFRRSYNELTRRIGGLACGRAKVIQTVETAERWGLVQVERGRKTNGAREPNSYRLDWEGIRHVRFHGTPLVPKSATQTRWSATQTRWSATQTLSKEVNPLLTKSISDTGSGGPPPKPEDLKFGNQDQNHSTLWERLAAESPLLAEARARRIAPLPSGSLVHGVYAALKAEHLRDALRLVKWFRMMLSTPAPVFGRNGDTEADLLVTLATALYAQSVPEADLVKNRVSLFVFTLSRGRFVRVLPFVPRARSLLDAGIARLGARWAGLAGDAEAMQDAELADQLQGSS